MRTLFGRTNMNPASRFIREIPEEFIEGIELKKQQTMHLRSGTSAVPPILPEAPSSTHAQRKPVMRPIADIDRRRGNRMECWR